MQKLVWLGACLMGLILIVGSWLLPNHVVMWFASSSAAFEYGRALLVAGLLTMAFVHVYYDHAYWRVLWLVTGIGLAWFGFNFFIDQPEYILDVLLMWAAASSFLIGSLRPAPEPLPLPKLASSLQSTAVTAYYNFRHPQETPVWLPDLRDVRQVGHRLVLQRRPQLLKQ